MRAWMPMGKGTTMNHSIVLGQSSRCDECGAEADPIEFDFAFQPMVSVNRRAIFAHEARARGPPANPRGRCSPKSRRETRSGSTRTAEAWPSGERPRFAWAPRCR